MIIKQVINHPKTTSVVIEYVGGRSRKIDLSQRELKEYNHSDCQTIAEYIGSKYGTDYPNKEEPSK